MSWICLVVAGLLEVGWAVGLKYTAGFTRLIPSLFTLLAMLGSVGMLGLALRDLPLGTAYAVWTGIGTVGTAAAGMLLLGEPAGAMRLGAIGLIVVGIIGLKVLTPHLGEAVMKAPPQRRRCRSAVVARRLVLSDCR